MNPGTLDEVMREISEKLDGILGFMAAKDINGDASLIVPKLKAMGMSVKTIALVSGISENAVAIRLTRMKKPATRKSGRVSKKKPASGNVPSGDATASDPGADPSSSAN